MNSKNKKSTIQNLVDHLATYKESFGKSRLNKFNNKKIKLEKQLWMEKIQKEQKAKPEIDSSLSKNDKNTLKQIIEEVQVEFITDGLKDLNDSVDRIKRSLNTIQNEQIVSRGTNDFILPSEETIDPDSEGSSYRINIKEEIDPSGAEELPIDLKTAKEELNSWMQQKKILNYGFQIDQGAVQHAQTNIDYWNKYIQIFEANEKQETLLEALNLPDQKNIDSKLSLEELVSSLNNLKRMYSMEQGFKDPDPEDSKYLEHRIEEVQNQIDLFNQDKVQKSGIESKRTRQLNEFPASESESIDLNKQEQQFKPVQSGAVDRKKEINSSWNELINKLDNEEIDLQTYRSEKAKLANEFNSILDEQANEQTNEFGAVGDQSKQSEGGQDTNEQNEPEKLVFLGRGGAVDNQKESFLHINLKKGAKLERKTNKAVWFIEEVFKNIESKELLFQIGTYQHIVWYSLKDLEESFNVIGV